MIFGGGRRKFLLNTTEDPENSNDTNEREDKDLVKVGRYRICNNDSVTVQLIDRDIGSLNKHSS